MWKKIRIGLNVKLYDVIIDNYSDLDMFCNTLANYILQKYPKTIAERVIKYNYGYFSENELHEISKLVLSKFKYDKNIIIEELIEYIENNDILILDGFVMFRLPDILCVMENIVDDIVNAMITQHEYDEFINLLKFFVDMQTPEIDIVHIIRNENKYLILDRYFKDITDECISDFLDELRYGTINYDDLLLSVLITLAPKNICIHRCNLISNKELLLTLKKIFNNRITFYETKNPMKISKINSIY